LKRPKNLSAWMCILAMLFAGCYHAAVIDLDGGDTGSIDPEQIDYVLMKDATKIQFETTPAIVQDALVGVTDGGRVSLPLSEISLIQMKKSFSGTTMIIGVAAAAVVGVTVVLAASGR
jgi:hypothetical protein